MVKRGWVTIGGGFGSVAMRIFWQNSMSFGLPEMDREHREMVSLLDRVCLALHGRNLDAAARALDDFAAAMTEHFHAEEVLLSEIGGEHMDHHVMVHRRTADVVSQLHQALVDHRDLGMAERLVGELVTQWIRRLFHEDADMAERVKATQSV